MKNILLIIADQHRFSSLGSSGNREVRSPVLDQMVNQGVSLSSCVSTHPLCAPYRACLQTGQPAAVNGVMWNEDNIRRDLPSLAHLFKAQGYSTAYFGKCHWHDAFNDSIFTPEEWRLGWDHWIGWQNGHEDMNLPTFDQHGNQLEEYAGRFAPEVQTEQFLEWHTKTDGPWIAQLNWGPPHNAGLTEEALDELRDESKKVSKDLNLGLQDHQFENGWWWVQSFPQHLVYDVVPQKYLDAFDHESLSVFPNVPHEKHLLVQYHLREYYAQIMALDELTGQIIAQLEKRDALENTVIIYTSDHGDYIGSHTAVDYTTRGKGSALQESVHVPFIGIGPGLKGGRQIDTPMATIDILPTLCGLAGFTPEADFPGSDLSSILRGESEPENRMVTMNMRNWEAAYDGRWIYAITLEDDQWKPASLFDTDNDPYSLTNLLGNDQHSEIQHQLHEFLTTR